MSPAPLTRPIKRALLSVSNKTNLVQFAQALHKHGVEIISTGGTAKAIRDAGLAVQDVSDITGFPEMMDGRVKTLHPKVHGGLLALRDDAGHQASMEDHGIAPIDLVVVNLYPFEETVERGASLEETIENIDIGGPAMIRSAAKNHKFVTVVVDVDDYDKIITALSDQGGADLSLRQHLAAKAYSHTAHYDTAISTWFQNQGLAQEGDVFPKSLSLTAKRVQILRYGENPHQQAAFYKAPGATRAGIATARQVQGKELSYNNLNDTDAAFELVSELGPAKPAIAIIKHANPCGVALGDSLEAAYQSAYECDSVSAFGGIVAANQKLDEATAEAITQIFTEVVIAPDADEAARAVFAKKKNLRLLLTGGLAKSAERGMTVKSVAGGYLLQSRDSGQIEADITGLTHPGALRVVTKRAPTDQELRDLLFAFQVAKHVKSNTIIYAKNEATVGIGAGQMSRLDSARIAARKAQDAAESLGLEAPRTQGCVVASDAFFPFADGLLAAAEAGATAVIQPGGSMRDEDVIAAADEQGLAMVMTSMRHFRH